MAAMACGKPVVYSATGGGARLVENAGAGIVVKPEDAQALADAIIRIVDDPEAAARMGANGRRCVEEGFTWRVLVERWLADLTHRLKAK
jgi:glycosyltransferase involved in cell wall biosynthesis